MGIRSCALACQAFAALRAAYTDRDAAARRWRAEGKKVVAKLGCDVPDELLLAADLMPLQVYADPAKPLTQTDTYLEFAFDPVVRAQFERIIDGTYAGLADFLAVSNSTDVIIRTYLYLRQLHRVEPERQMPQIAFIDWLFTRNRLHQVRNEHTLQLFREQVEQWSGKPVTDEAIEAAAALCNAGRAALRRIGALRKAAKISGTEALVIIGAAGFMDRKEHTDLCNAVADAAETWPVIAGPKVFVTGSNQEDLGLYERIESAGAVVVSEDFDWGDRYYDRDYDLSLPPIRAIVDRYMLREFSSKKAFVSQRVAALEREVAAAGAQAVVFYNHIYEEAASWDYPSQKQMLDAKGIPSANFCKMQWPIGKNAGLDEAINAFITGLKGGF